MPHCQAHKAERHQYIIGMIRKKNPTMPRCPPSLQMPPLRGLIFWGNQTFYTNTAPTGLLSQISAILLIGPPKLTPMVLLYLHTLSPLDGANNLDFTVLAKFRGLPLRFRDNFPIHRNSDASLRRIQF